MIKTPREAREASTEQLVNELITNPEHRWCVGPELEKRMVKDGCGTLVDFLRRKWLIDQNDAGASKEVLETFDRAVRASEPRWHHDPIHELAKDCVRTGFLGQGMHNEANARIYILMAAENPNVSEELPESGKAFWRAVPFARRVWLLEKKGEAK